MDFVPRPSHLVAGVADPVGGVVDPPPCDVKLGCTAWQWRVQRSSVGLGSGSGTDATAAAAWAGAHQRRRRATAAPALFWLRRRRNSRYAVARSQQPVVDKVCGWWC